MEQIGEKFRELRNQQSFTLKEMSEKTGLSISFLSQVERGTSSLAITSLKKIADAFNVPMTYFFESYKNQNFHVKASEAQPFQIVGRSAEYVRLGGEFPSRVVEPLLVTLSPGLIQEQVFSHPGEEFNYILEGVAIFNVDNKEYYVRSGESIHFPSILPHFLANPLQQKCKILCVLTPVIF